MGKVAVNVLGKGTWQQTEVSLRVDDQQLLGETSTPTMCWPANGLREGAP